MEIRVIAEKIVHKNIIKAYDLSIGGKILHVEKWFDTNMKDGDERGFSVANQKEIIEVLGAEEWNKLVAFINNLKLE